MWASQVSRVSRQAQWIVTIGLPAMFVRHCSGCAKLRREGLAQVPGLGASLLLLPRSATAPLEFLPAFAGSPAVCALAYPCLSAASATLVPCPHRESQLRARAVCGAEMLVGSRRTCLACFGGLRVSYCLTIGVATLRAGHWCSGDFASREERQRSRSISFPIASCARSCDSRRASCRAGLVDGALRTNCIWG